MRSMIVGDGLLATAFRGEYGGDPAVTIFASGVSNSTETSSSAFAREAGLLRSEVARSKGLLVYFSTCSLTDPDRAATPYTEHKAEMEALVREREEWLILRLPQVVGRTGNPHTLTNFIAGKIMAGESFTIWARAIRNLIDVDDVFLIGSSLIRGETAKRTIDVATPVSTTMQELVLLMENAIGRKAQYSMADRGGGCHPDSTLAASIADRLGIDFSPEYPQRLLRKYYGAR